MAEMTYTLVTGASSGIGRAIAIASSKTDNLILHGRNRQKLEETMRFCTGGNHVIWTYDLANVDSLQQDFEQFVTASKLSISKFVHSAGVASPCAIRAVDLEYVRRLVNVNAFSAMLLTGSLMKRKIAATTMESIVFISAVSAGMGTSGSAVYGASKAMLDGFVKSAAIELAPKVRINSIRPGFIKSKMTDAFFSVPDTIDAITKRHPLGIGTVEDIVDSVEFLFSKKSRWITGQFLTVDGGLSCNLTFK